MDKIEFAPDWPHPYVIGVDEVNYSPSLAGDCVVCAAYLPLDEPIEGIDDSKKLTHKQRLELFEKIIEKAVYTIAPASSTDIGIFGVYFARNFAAKLAWHGTYNKLLTLQEEKKIDIPDAYFADSFVGYKICTICDMGLKKAFPSAMHVPAADEKSYVVGAASIIAKVYMDALFEGYDEFWPGYRLSSNHGSVGNVHKAMLRELGPSPVHRGGIYAPNWWKIIYPEGEKWG